jgi:hypothetical protein
MIIIRSYIYFLKYWLHIIDLNSYFRKIKIIKQTVLTDSFVITEFYKKNNK